MAEELHGFSPQILRRSRPRLGYDLSAADTECGAAVAARATGATGARDQHPAPSRLGLRRFELVNLPVEATGDDAENAFHGEIVTRGSEHTGGQRVKFEVCELVVGILLGKRVRPLATSSTPAAGSMPYTMAPSSSM